jgi:hypothetical protein
MINKEELKRYILKKELRGLETEFKIYNQAKLQHYKEKRNKINKRMKELKEVLRE